ncbi:MAG: glycosyl hydrolase, partial [Armatimonadetes bacterium]|nr:glycosyl hydrolase [Armatimonadota bacterium]
MNADIRSLRAQFADPGKAYRPMPFWFLNHDLTERELRRQIAEMDTQGVGGAVLHARHGLLTPFMSSEWLDMVGVCIHECRMRGMEVWLYDEDNWPSGTFGGKLTRPNPELRMRYLRVEEMPTGQGANLTPPPGNRLIAVYALGPDGACEMLLQGPESAGSGAPPAQAHCCAPAPGWKLVVCWECEVAEDVTFFRGYYLDTMNPEAGKAFINLAYEPYWERFGADFGGAVKGVFTDEPGLMIHDGFFGSGSMRTTVEALNGSLPGLVLPWTRDLPARWRKETGADLLPILPALLYEVGPDWQQTRLDFYDACTRWYLGAYHGAISGWCSRRGIEYIGHTLEEPLWGQIRTQGNQTRVLEQFHRPGLDYLMTGIGTREHPHRILSVKCASSVAHVQGKPRVAVEAFGGSGHGHSLAARKLDAAFMAVLGVNMYIPHAFYYSFDGYRKTDWPPTEFFHAPHWPHYKAFADFLARLSLVQSSGTHVADVALLSPVRSAQTRIFHGGRCNHALPEDAVYAFVSDRLLRRHIDYDYLDDSQLLRAEVRGGRLRFAGSQESYPTLVMPLCQVLSPAAAARIRDVHINGGNVMAIGRVPDTADDGDHLAVRQAMATVFGADPEPDAVRTSAAGGSAVFVRDWVGRDGAIADLLASFSSPVASCVLPDGSSAEDVLLSVRRVGEATVCMIVNTLEAPQQVVLDLRQPGPAAEWEVETGAARRLASAPDGAGGTRVTLELGPQACRLVVLGAEPEEPCAAARRLGGTAERRLALPSAWSFSTRDPNVLPLDRWQCSLRDRAASAAERQGVAGQVNTYSTRFVVRHRPASLRLVLDNLKQWVPPHMGFLSHFRSLEIYVNGRRLPPLVPSNWQDPYYLMQDVTDAVAVGVNTVEIRAISSLEPMHGLLDPAYLVGAFGLADGEMVEPAATISGFWTDAGRPYYSGIGVYEQTLEAPADAVGASHAVLRLGDVRDGAAVTVNGRPAGTRLWMPFEVHVSGLLRPGA